MGLKRPMRELEEEVMGLASENTRLREALEKDQTGLVTALGSISREVDARRWITEGRGPYAYDEEEYRKETGYALDAIKKTAGDALAVSSRLVWATIGGDSVQDLRSAD